MSRATMPWVILLFALSPFACDTKVKTNDSCGDGFLDPGEACDGADLNQQSCQSLGYYLPTGALGCRSDCTFDLSGCGGAFCGNGLADGPEECEGSQLQGATCQSQGHYPGTLACAGDCRFDFSGCGGTCGDGVVQELHGEACDPGAFDTTCPGLGAWHGEVTCSACLLDETGCRRARQVVVGETHACALDDQGTIHCWGSNGSGQLGIGSAEPSSLVPVPLAAPEGVRFTAVAAGKLHTCALDEEGLAWCWGYNDSGQLGIYDVQVTHATAPLAVLMPDGTRFSALSARNDTTCALDLFGRAWCWGVNYYGQLGGGTIGGTLGLPSEVIMPAVGDFASLSVGAFHVCALGQDGQAFCWGLNDAGQLGTGSTVISEAPAMVSTGLRFTAIATGGSHSCATRAEGGVFCWGRNDFGQLGNDGHVDQTSPVAVTMPLDTTFVRLGLGATASCAVDADDQVWCWGGDFNGVLGNGAANDSPTPSPVVMPDDHGFSTVFCHFYTCCATGAGGSVWCWGANSGGQLGIGTLENADAPGPVLAPAP